MYCNPTLAWHSTAKVGITYTMNSLSLCLSEQFVSVTFIIAVPANPIMQAFICVLFLVM